MYVETEPSGRPFLIILELCMTAFALAASLAFPYLGKRHFPGARQAFRKFAGRKRLAVVTVGALTLLLRVALLPLLPTPLPLTPDDFSNLLAADTFEHGRLTNPTPAMWTHFETIHETMQPTYTTMYFPGEGLTLAAGKVLLGHPWYGILLADVLMCASLCWMLQAWLPPVWAFFGGLLCILHLGLFSYWVNTYTGAAPMAALGGALVLGALPRLMKSPRHRYGILIALGIVLLILTRPYEGFLLCLPSAFVLVRWILKGKNRPSLGKLVLMAVLPLLILAAAFAWLGYYDYRAFGNPRTLPYTIDRATYAVTPYFVWQSLKPDPVYRHEELRRFYHDEELTFFNDIHGWKGFFIQTKNKMTWGILFFAGIAFFPLLLMTRRICLDRRIRFLVICMAFLIAGMSIEIYLVPHYLAPFTVVFYALGLQAMRHLSVWKFEGQPSGMALTRLLVAICLIIACIRVVLVPLHRGPTEWPPSEWLWKWYGPPLLGTTRFQVEQKLAQSPGKQLVLVRYAPDHGTYDEWVYNGADIDGSKIIWAREMDASSNAELIHYYKDRTVWLVQPDSAQSLLSPYPMTELAAFRQP